MNSSGAPVQLKGVNLAGYDLGEKESSSGAGAFLWYSALTNSNSAKDKTTFIEMVYNIMQTLHDEWGANVLRIPICTRYSMLAYARQVHSLTCWLTYGSAWMQNYEVTNYAGEVLMTYREMVNATVFAARSFGMVSIIDNQVWAVATTTCVDGMLAGCTDKTTAQCAPSNFYNSQERTCTSSDGKKSIMCWECPTSLDDGNTVASAVLNLDLLEQAWTSIATEFRDSGDVFFELWSEPFESTCELSGVGTADYDWTSWALVMDTLITAVRDTANSSNVIIVSGLDYGYDYYGDGTTTNGGPIVRPSLLTWASRANIAYSFHPYQGAACCGSIGTDTDESATDPYQAAFCVYYPGCDAYGGGSVSDSYLPTIGSSGAYDTCSQKGTGFYLAKIGPCVAVSTNVCGVNYCTGAARDVCSTLGDSCPALSDSNEELKQAWSNASYGGWSQHALGMQQYGPLIATEFGTYDCSSPCK
jgi:hypothetical protein